jgi:hypothetical protein
MTSVNGSRNLRRSSKKGSKKGSKKSSRGMDFSSILNDMDDNQMTPQQNQGHQMNPMMQQQMNPMMQQQMMPSMPGMSAMPGMGMDPLAMAQMATPNMGMPQMMMGASADNVDPLHLQHFVPQNQNAQIDNFGVNPSQLMSGSQISQQYRGREAAPMQAPAMPAMPAMPANQMGGGSMFSAYDSFVNKFM